MPNPGRIAESRAPQSTARRAGSSPRSVSRQPCPLKSRFLRPHASSPATTPVPARPRRPESQAARAWGPADTVTRLLRQGAETDAALAALDELVRHAKGMERARLEAEMRAADLVHEAQARISRQVCLCARGFAHWYLHLRVGFPSLYRTSQR